MRGHGFGFAARVVGRVSFAFAFAVAAGCGGDANVYAPPPPPEVTVAHPIEQEVTQRLDFTGTVRGYESVEIRARVEGFIDQIHFAPGGDVMPGDLLFTIDPRPFKATVDQRAAEVERSKSALDLAEVTLERITRAAERDAASDLEVRERKADRDAAKAELEFSKARHDAAMLDLTFTEVRAPIAGVISRNLVDVGALVGAGEPTLLTTIVSQDRVYAYFDLSEQDLLRIRHDNRERGEEDKRGRDLPVLMAFEDEPEFMREGRIDSADNTVNPDTGTIRIRALFDNPEREIVPGMFVRLRVVFGTAPAVLVPRVALSSDQQGPYALAVDEAGMVERRPVSIGVEEGVYRVITEGVKADDWIVVNGIQRARPGAKVTPIRQGAGSGDSGGGGAGGGAEAPAGGDAPAGAGGAGS